jgi:hypothetical protein
MVLSGHAHLAANGLPANVQTQGLSDGDLRALAGEAFSAPNSAQVMLAFYANPFAPWWDVAHDGRFPAHAE